MNRKEIVLGSDSVMNSDCGKTNRKEIVSDWR